MAITSSTTTALDVPSLVSQLMAVERRPIDQINARIASYETKISSYGTLSSLVSSFQSAATSLGVSLQKMTATGSDANVLTASADFTATPGSYAIDVSKLAQSQNLVAAGQVSSTAAIGDGTATTVTFDFGTISGGTLTNGVYSGASFTSNGSGTVNIVIDSTNNTLEGIRDAINAAGLDVRASIVNDGSGTPYRLALNSTNPGVSNSLKITTSGGDGTVGSLLGYDPAGTQNMTQALAAQNANLTVNGIAITSASNTLTQAIPGVSLTLKSTTAATTTLTVARDTSAIGTGVASLVDAYNALASQLKSRSAYGTNGQGAGALAGDSALRLMQEQLRGIFNTPATGGALTRLSEVGISFQRDGSLKLDTVKLNNAVNTSFSDVSNLFTSASGFATRFEAWGQSTLGAGGLIETRTKNLNQFVKDKNEEIDRLEIRMAALEKKYRTEYSNLNLLLSRMNSTSTFLTNQLNLGESK